MSINSDVSCISWEVMYRDGMTQAPEQTTAKGWRPDDSTFGARLALIRQRMGWGNVREAAVVCGIPPESWRTWERDNVAPRRLVEMAGLIANRTGCDFYWLIAGPQTGGRGAPVDIPHGISPLAERSLTLIDRPRDNRPNGRPSAVATAPITRTGYLDRNARRRRDR